MTVRLAIAELSSQAIQGKINVLFKKRGSPVLLERIEYVKEV